MLLPCVNPSCGDDVTHWRRRGLCWRCYRSKLKRTQHEPLSAYTRDNYLPSWMPKAVTAARPGSPAKRQEMTTRASRHEALHHDDEPLLARRQWFGMLQLLADVMPPRTLPAPAPLERAG